MTLRGTLIALALLVALATPALAAGSAPTTLTIAVPPQVELGQLAQARARLTDASGTPIAKATVLFTATLGFLSGESEVVLADARTDAAGVAVGEFEARTEGTLTIGAVFAGNDTYAPARASAPMTVEGSDQLYVQHAGVHLPGLNAGPAAVPVLGDRGVSLGVIPGTSRLWPAMSGWPIALVLMIVWSLYGLVVARMFRLARAAPDRPGP